MIIYKWLKTKVTRVKICMQHMKSWSLLRYKLNIGQIGCASWEPVRFVRKPGGYPGCVNQVRKPVRNKRPDRCVNREVVGHIFREGIYLGVSEGAHLWALKYVLVLLSVRMDLYKSALWVKSDVHSVIILNQISVCLCSLCLSRILCVLGLKLSIKPVFSFGILCSV